MGNDEWVTPAHSFIVRQHMVRAQYIFDDTKEFNVPVYTLSMLSSEPEERMREADTERSFQLGNGYFVTNAMPVKTY